METTSETRQRILLLMRDRLMQAGYSKVTIDEIADELGISKKTLYKHFSSKEELAMEAVRFQFFQIEAGFRAIHESTHTVTDRLHAVLMLIRQQVGKVSIFAIQDMRKHAPQLWKEIERLRRERILTKLELMVRQAREEGVLRPHVDERILVKLLLSSVEAIANPDSQAELGMPMEEILQSVFRIVFGGALTDDARMKAGLFGEPAEPAKTTG